MRSWQAGAVKFQMGGGLCDLDEAVSTAGVLYERLIVLITTRILALGSGLQKLASNILVHSLSSWTMEHALRPM